ncbi:MAG: hypothetical protein J3Q66DRAFT_64670 [Benniella sp.]|nr:MAG: hypothetical protein J3Q66DRAFT_64670 [Benniella sp.]
MANRFRSLSSEPTKIIGELKDAIKKTPRFDDVAADELALWRVSFPVAPKKERKEISQADVLSKEELDEMFPMSCQINHPRKQSTSSSALLKFMDLSLFEFLLHSLAICRMNLVLTRHFLATSMPIRKIMDRFFVPGPIANFLDAFVKGEGLLPATSGLIAG